MIQNLRENKVVDPKDWRNIPACVVNTTDAILERLTHLEKKFDSHKQNTDTRSQKLQGQLSRIKNDNHK